MSVTELKRRAADALWAVAGVGIILLLAYSLHACAEWKRDECLGHRPCGQTAKIGDDRV